MIDLQRVESLLADGRLQEAGQACRDAIAADDGDADAWHLLGIVNAQSGDLSGARDCFAGAARRDPDRALFPYNLALAHRGLGETDQAILAYQTALELRDDFHEARNNLGNALIDACRMEDALLCFEELVRQCPDSGDAHFNLANTCQELRRTDEAVLHYQRAIEIDAEKSAARENLGRAYCDAKRFDDAIQVWRDWLDIEPGHPYATHMLAAATGELTPPRCDEEYVRQEFNVDFARSFDRQMARLNYQSPKLIQEAIAAMDPPIRNARVLDVGCGTGIGGLMLRRHAKHLVGVDLSDAMLDQARRHDVYDELVEAEIEGYMNNHAAEYDLVVSCDTLCYFGTLETVLAATQKSLQPGGLMFFTVEKDSQPSPGYRLQRHGRYCHREDYVRGVLDSLELETIDVVTAIQRYELGRGVEGLIVTAKKPAA